MKSQCRKLKRILAEQGTAGLRENQALQEHAAKCALCFTYLEAAAELEEEAAGLNVYTPKPVIVAELLQRVAEDAAPEARTAPKLARAAEFFAEHRRLQLFMVCLLGAALFFLIAGWLHLNSPWAALVMLSLVIGTVISTYTKRYRAAGALATACLALFLLGHMSSIFFKDQILLPGDYSRRLSQGPVVLDEARSHAEGYNDTSLSSNLNQALATLEQFNRPFSSKGSEPSARTPEKMALGKNKEVYADLIMKPGSAPAPEQAPEGESNARVDHGLMQLRGSTDEAKSETRRYSPEEQDGQFTKEAVKSLREDITELPKRQGFRTGAAVDQKQVYNKLHKAEAPRVLDGEQSGSSLELQQAEESSINEERLGVDAFEPLQRLRSEKKDSDQIDLNLSKKRGLSGSAYGGAAPLKDVRGRKAGEPRPAKAALPRELFRAFLDDRARVDDLLYKDPSGYWSNTYIPGDPELLRLALQLQGEDRSRLRAGLTTGKLPDEYSQEPRQFFDPPENAALGVFLSADTSALNEGKPTRFLLQVGLQATKRQSGNRPALTLGLVADLRSAPAGEYPRLLETLLQAFTKVRGPGDQFSLYVAGPSGVLVIPSAEFRYGTVKVMLQNVCSARTKPPAQPAYGLRAALNKALEEIKSSENPQAVLGSSSIILISGRSLNQELQGLSEFAHESAVAGVPVSVMGLGGSFDPADLNTLSLAGQGNRRFVRTASEVEAAVERELTSIGRVVARALRLRIQLAANVKLVDVLGSYRLDEAAAERTRKAEQAVAELKSGV